jgi:hypothetical protein
VLVQEAAGLDVGAHRQRGGVLAAVEEHGRAGHSKALLPGGQHGEGRERDEQRQPRPMRDLREVRREEQQLHREERTGAERASHRGFRHCLCTL